MSEGRVPDGHTRRRDLACPKCGRDAVEGPDADRTFRFSCINYWGGSPKCWTCASPRSRMIDRGEQLAMF